jgi:hypothetical protein
MTEQQAANHSAGMVAKQSMRIFVDICICDLFPDKLQAHLLWWVKKRKDLLQQRCKKLHIDKMQEVLHIIHLDHSGSCR